MNQPQTPELDRIGRNIQAARAQHKRSGDEQARKTTQERLALDTELARSHIGQIERGEINVSAMVLVKIARALDVSPAQLWDGV